MVGEQKKEMMRLKKKKSQLKTLLVVSACALSFAAASSAERYVLAYLPFGGGWSSRIMLVNPGDQATQIELQFFSAGDSPLVLSSSAASDATSLRLEPGATQSIQIDSIVGEPTGLSWALAQSDTPVQVFSTFDFSVPQTRSETASIAAKQSPAEEDCPTCVGQLSSGGGVDEMGPPPSPPGQPDDRPPTGPRPGRPADRPPVSVPVTTPVVVARVSRIAGATVLPSGRGFVFPVSVYGSKNFNAFLAIANPNEAPANVSLNLSYGDGLQTVNRVLQLPPRGQMTRLLTDQSLFDQVEAPPDGFDGTVTVCSDAPVGLVALGLAGELAYTLPVSTSQSCPASD